MSKQAIATIPTVVLGASGYVGGELLRLLALHPRLELHAALSGSQAGRPLVDVFPHLRGVWDGHRWEGHSFVDHSALDVLIATGQPVAVFACLPHGKSAEHIDRLQSQAADSDTPVHLVDLSADFRLPSPAEYEAVYGGNHGAPHRYEDFSCGLPELSPDPPPLHVAHPGCFTTATVLACAPAQAAGVAEPCYRVSAVTGSTGSGKTPSATTHHPDRHGNIKAYSPLSHRHAPEMEMLLGRLGGQAPEVCFVPHSGPWSRGIHATVHFDLVEPMTTAKLTEHYANFYESAPFVSVSETPPRLKDVVATNRCQINVAARGRRAVAVAVIDNLTKGSAGGAMHWMNRLCGFPETTGLELPGVGWS